MNFYTPIPRAVELTGATKWLNGIYTRAAGKFCNGKPVYHSVKVDDEEGLKELVTGLVEASTLA